MGPRQKRFSSASAAMLAGMLATACAQTQWHRPDTEAALLKSDLDLCRQEARLYGGAVVSQPPPVLLSENPIREFNHTNACMQQKGYQLVRGSR
jgi:hypothetical protein